MKLVKESIRKFLKPKTQEEVDKVIQGMSQSEKDYQLLNAIHQEDLTLVKVLLDAGADPTKHGVMSYAAHTDKDDFVYLLAEKGADPNESDGQPLLNAIRHSNHVTLHALLDVGADPNLPDNPATAAVFNEDPTSIIALAHAGLDEAKLNHAFEAALQMEYLELIDTILSVGGGSHFQIERALKDAIDLQDDDMIELLRSYLNRRR